MAYALVKDPPVTASDVLEMGAEDVVAVVDILNPPLTLRAVLGNLLLPPDTLHSLSTI